MNKIVKHKWYWMTLAVMTLVFYILNLNTSLWGDDYIYALIPGNERERCDTLAKYIASMHYFYVDTNGRIADMIVRFICSLVGKTVFNILNTAVFAVFVHTLVQLVNRIERNAWLLAVIFLYVMLLFPYPGETMLWMAGAVNYLWSATATMLVLLYIVRHNEVGNHKANIFEHVALAMGAFIAGGMNESITTATLVAMGGYFLFNFKQWRGTNVTITIFYLLGTILIISSPAAWTRLESGNSVNLHMGALSLISQRCINLTTKTGHYVTPFLAYITLLVLLRRKGIKAVASDLLNWTIIGAMVSILVFGVTQQRAYTWYSITGFIVIAAALLPWINSRKKVATYTGIITGIACLIPAWYALKTTHDYKVYDDTVLADIQASPDGVLKAYPTPAETRFYHPLHYDNTIETCWNVFMDYYYNKDNIQFLNDSLYARHTSKLPILHGGKPLNYESSNPEYASTIYAFEGADYSILPIVCDSVRDRLGLITKLYYTDMEAHIGSDRAATRKLWGTMRDYEPFKQYHLKRDGKLYVVLPALNDSITSLEIPIRIGEKKSTITFTLNN